MHMFICAMHLKYLQKMLHANRRNTVKTQVKSKILENYNTIRIIPKDFKLAAVYEKGVYIFICKHERFWKFQKN